MPLPGLPKGLFVTGTDTGVGKTIVAAGIALFLREKGIDVGVMKPVETGCHSRDGRLVPQDAIFLRGMTDSDDEMELINPYALSDPLAPAIAAQSEGVHIDLEVIQRAYRALSNRHQVVIVEGAGGILVPLTETHFMADLASSLGLSILLVSRASLGAINHTLLSLSYLAQRGLPVLGVIMDHTTAESGLAEETNAEALKHWATCPFLGAMPFLPHVDRASLLAAATANIDMNCLYRGPPER